jgi:hypothetical protein
MGFPARFVVFVYFLKKRAGNPMCEIILSSTAPRRIPGTNGRYRKFLNVLGGIVGWVCGNRTPDITNC